MLKQVLEEIKIVNAPVTVQALSRRLRIDPSALQGMIEFWVRKGELRDDDAADECAPDGGCGSSCTGAASCSFIVDMPRSYSLRL